MKKILFLQTALALATLTIGQAIAQDVLQYVNPGIGTAHSRWFFFTPAAVPGGMAKLAPSTNGSYGNAQGWEAVGYDVRHNSIEGFVHFHEWQVGGVSFMPTTGELKVVPGQLDKPSSGYRSVFDRKNEVAQPGYYKVKLDDYQITAELTATKRVGFHRYTFPKSTNAHIVLDIGRKQGESGEATDAEIHMIDATHFSGYVYTYPKYVASYDPGGKVAMFIYGELGKKPSSVTAFTKAGTKPGQKAAKGVGAGLALNYKTVAGEKIEVKVGLSYTSVANAKANFIAEAAKLKFDSALELAKKTWRQELNKLQVESNIEADKIKFYTGLYHALLGRGLASDVNGAYPKHRATIGQLSAQEKKHGFINTDAIWGGYWNLTQLWSLAYPEWYERFVNTQLRLYKDKGWFGDGIANSEYASGVGTNFVGLAIAAAYQVGIRSFDTKLAYEAVKNNELGWRNRLVGSGKMDTRAFLKYGYVPHLDGDGSNFVTDSTGSNFSASHTLEYSYSAFAAAQMAKALGKTSDYKQLINYAEGWDKLFNSASKLIQPKTAEGKFIERFDPMQPWRGFQEGNATQYTFFVPHNPKALINAVGDSTFNSRLNTIFEASEKNGFGGGKTIDAFAGVNALYNQGNQPNLHIGWLFNFSGKPWLTQKWIHSICNEFYGTESIHGYGYGQDEDQGQLGSWYVLSSLGLFDVKGFTDQRPIIQFGSPIFNTARISLLAGKTLQIETRNNAKDNVYVQSLTFNGKPVENCWMYRDELMKGGKLVFVMGKQPNQKWGTKTPPPSIQ
ncbi:GH92 family glycosyl hydrolase [uncultured Mucilaginibacter sp.]|uniref:GH92 family glycosyl hydrolase n=1 Tax=uncultured Mucilaginibacter sp. TaxID=797541 RepID=UPI0025E23520|nr:GH92 family glycosyl hydrolase [uncultured Mucilaginibacter sp.]